MCRAAFFPCPTPTVTVRSAGTMSPPAKIPGAPVIIPAETCTVPSPANSTPGTRRRNPESDSWPEREDHRVRGQRLQPAGRTRSPRLVELHHLDRELGSVERGDRAQPVDPHPFASRRGRLLGVRRHLRPGPPVDDDGLVRAEPAGHPGGVHGRVATAVHRDPAADHRLAAGRDRVQERHRVDDPAGVPGRDVDPLGQVRADGHEDRVEAAGPPLGDEVLDPVVQREPHAQRGDPGHLAVEDVPRQPVRRDAVAHHAARLTERVADLDLVSPHRQVIGRGQAARTGTDDQDPLARTRRRRIEAPPLGEREVAEEALRRMDGDGAVELGPVAAGLARVVADPAVDRRQRVVPDQLPPGLLVPAGLQVREPGLDVLAGGTGGVARRKQVDVDRTGLPGRTGTGGAVQEVRQRREVISPGGHDHAPDVPDMPPPSPDCSPTPPQRSDWETTRALRPVSQRRRRSILPKLINGPGGPVRQPPDTRRA